MNLDFKFEITLNLCTFWDKAQWIVDTFSDTLDSNAIDYCNALCYFYYVDYCAFTCMYRH